MKWQDLIFGVFFRCVMFISCSSSSNIVFLQHWIVISRGQTSTVACQWSNTNVCLNKKKHNIWTGKCVYPPGNEVLVCVILRFKLLTCGIKGSLRRVWNKNPSDKHWGTISHTAMLMGKQEVTSTMVGQPWYRSYLYMNLCKPNQMPIMK